MKFSIAIDGPAASGKSSTAEHVAKQLGFQRIDSGLIYRAVTYTVINQFGRNADLNNENVKKFIENLEIKQVKSRTFNGESDISDYLRTAEIDSNVGKIANELFVRMKVLQIQKEALKHDVTGIVVDGRDIGTVVIPNAFLKIYVTAKDTTRAMRRSKQTGQNYEQVLEELRARDYNDMNRVHGALKVAEDAIVIENDELSKDRTVEMIIKIFNAKLKNLK